MPKRRPQAVQTPLLGSGFNIPVETAPTTGLNQLAPVRGFGGVATQQQQQQQQQGTCCFIFMEAYNGMLPDSVRICRDHFYREEPRLAVGYCRMAEWLVPKMKRSSLVKWAVNLFMVKPLTDRAEYLCGNKSNTLRGLFAQHLWFAVWRKM